MDTSSPALLLEKLWKFAVPSDVGEGNILVNLFVSGIFLESRDVNVHLKAVDILMKTNPGFQLPLLLYSISKITCPTLLLKLLHCLPLTAVMKVSSNLYIQHRMNPRGNLRFEYNLNDCD